MKNSIRRILNLFKGRPSVVSVPEEQARTPKEAAIESAMRWAQEQGLRWKDPISSELLAGPDGQYWLIRSNYPGRGFRVVVQVDDRSGEAVAGRTLPR